MTLLTTDTGGAGNAQTGGQASSQTGSSGSNGVGLNNGTGVVSGGTNGSGAPASNWRDSLPDDLKTDASLLNFTDVSSLAKSYIHTKSQVGKKGVVVPGEKATAEEWDYFYDSVGRPAKDKYEINLPKGQDLDETKVGWFKEHAHKHGLLPRQAQAFLEDYLGFEKKGWETKSQELQQIAAEQLKDLQKEWGQGYAKNVELAKMVLKEAPPEMAEYLEETGLGNDVKLVKFLSELGRKFLGEDKIRGEVAGRMGQTPDEMDAEISRLRDDPSFLDKKNPSYFSTQRKLQELYQARYQ